LFLRLLLSFSGAAASKGRQQAARGAKRQATRGGRGRACPPQAGRPARSACGASAATRSEGGTPKGAEGRGPLQAARAPVRTARDAGCIAARDVLPGCPRHACEQRPQCRPKRSDAVTRTQRSTQHDEDVRRATADRAAVRPTADPGAAPVAASLREADSTAAAQRSGLPRLPWLCCVRLLHHLHRFGKFAHSHPEGPRLVRPVVHVGSTRKPRRFEHSRFCWS
jgi:hypothetical protein